jgi:outer membrane protein
MNKKHLITIAVALLPFLSLAQKFGHVNSADLLAMMPEVKKADSTLALYQKSLEDLNQTMLVEYQQKIQTYQNDLATMTDAVKELREQEIKDLEKRITDFQAGAPEKLQGKKEEVYTPILKKAEDAIKAVAKENNYAYVFDTSAGGVIYAQESDDISGLVKKKLGLQ